MRRKFLVPMFLSIGALVVVITLFITPLVFAANSSRTPKLIDQVRNATEQFEDVQAAQAAGYALLHGCVSGSQGGAMGVHFVNGDLVGDGLIDAAKPEALIYEWKNDRFQLVGVEYVVLADEWNALNETPPVLNGQLFSLSGSPNRYGIPAFYALHIWAWRNNPNGMFADWNSRVSCEHYSGETAQ